MSASHDVTIVHLLCKEDLRPEYSGDLELVDTELGDRLTVSVTDEIATSYRERVEGWRQEVASIARGTGAAYLPIDASDDVEQLVLQTWLSQGVLR